MNVLSGYAKTMLETTEEIDADFEFLSKYNNQYSKTFDSINFPISNKYFSKAI